MMRHPVFRPARGHHTGPMWQRTPVLGLLVLVTVALALPATGSAASGSGGVAAPGARVGNDAAPSAGKDAGASSGGAVPGKKYTPRHRLVASMFHLVDRSVTVGQSVPRVVVQLTQPDVAKVVAYVQMTTPSGKAVRLDLGTVSTGKRLTLTLPRSRTPKLSASGAYALRLSATTAQGQQLTRTALSPGRATLTVKAKPKKVDPTPVEVKPTPVSKVPTSTSPSSSSSVRFPVAGPHGFGGSGSRFGVGRVGHTHQGQDVPADAGTPVVAPTAGRITFTGYQAAGAGEWVAMHSTDGRDFFFAHCVRRSTAVSEGDSVRAGSHLCDVGTTGDSSGPHLHFEIWINGWRTSSSSHPIDPLPQLKLWQSADPKW